MGVIATRINGEFDKGFRQLCKQRGLTVSQGLNELVNNAVNDGLNNELPEDIPKVNTVLKNVDTTEDTTEKKLEKVQELKLEITKLAMKQGSGESRHISDLFFYDEELQGLITGLRSELDTLLKEIETDQQAGRGELNHEV